MWLFLSFGSLVRRSPPASKVCRIDDGVHERERARGVDTIWLARRGKHQKKTQSAMWDIMAVFRLSGVFIPATVKF